MELRAFRKQHYFKRLTKRIPKIETINIDDLLVAQEPKEELPQEPLPDDTHYVPEEDMEYEHFLLLQEELASDEERTPQYDNIRRERLKEKNALKNSNEIKSHMS